MRREPNRRRVLLVEDESLVAMLAEDRMLDLGCEVAIAVDKQLWFLEAHVQEPTGQMRDGDART